MTMDTRSYPNSLQENLLTLLFHYDKAGKKVADAIDPNLFEGDYRVFAERAIEYWKKYQKAPQQHTRPTCSTTSSGAHTIEGQ
jgi:hypothetical protein